MEFESASGDSMAGANGRDFYHAQKKGLNFLKLSKKVCIYYFVQVLG